MQRRSQQSIPSIHILSFLLCVLSLSTRLLGQTDCEAGNGLLNFAQPKSMSVQDVTQKFGAAESLTRQSRLHYTYKQEVLMQTLSGKQVTGEFHKLTNVSYDEKGRRQEVVTFAVQNSLRGIQLTAEDMEDIRTFMPLMLTSEDLPQYSLTYAGSNMWMTLTHTYFMSSQRKNRRIADIFKGACGLMRTIFSS